MARETSPDATEPSSDRHTPPYLVRRDGDAVGRLPHARNQPRLDAGDDHDMTDMIDTTDMTKMTLLEDQPRLDAAQWGSGEALAFGRTIPRRPFCRRTPFRVGGAPRRAGGGRRGAVAAREAHAASVSGVGRAALGARRRSSVSQGRVGVRFSLRSISLCAGGCATKRRETSEPGRATYATR